ncbi:MAG: hypothetical protein ACT6Q8_06755 [Niveispirillum sp.]|uniref:hypothetical protein n=1 Tax=Niveispirillum sp. TaxID=1917217 RepID=UPI004035F1B7
MKEIYSVEAVVVKNRSNIQSDQTRCLSGFEAANLKVARAKRHYEELHGILSNYVASSPFRLRVCYDNEKENTIVKAHLLSPIPSAVSAVVGDIFHNIRSSLDVAIYGVLENRVENRRSIQFPFSADELNLKSRMQKCEIDKGPIELYNFIVSTRPFKLGNEVLWSVNELNNLDKHRMILPALTITSIPVNILHDIHPAIPDIIGGAVFIWSSSEIFRIPLKNLNRVGRRIERIYHRDIRNDNLFKLSIELPSGRFVDFLEFLDNSINEISKTLQDMKKICEVL